MTNFSFQAHHTFPASLLERFAPEISALFNDNPINPFSANAARNFVPLFEDPAMAQAWAAAHPSGSGVFGANIHPNGNPHTGLRAFLAAELVNIFDVELGFTENQRIASLNQL
ncbi:hypothetical protein [Roseinatronobacter alkalisoli]|uniref:Uncharacterized protein n=1 Tax=Roseinatronobacter alkalisoli TaxID=3028235 RepID=A0ABT5TCW5_9RHOB|nr:hypothetical protein [Roseinatronobacter sp. HJB301]MDD7972971.1 hypothetical protein [Roseinatronobacter sp. HJB301]